MDAYLNLKFPVVCLSEENPIARLVLERSGGDHHLLIALKLAGTALASAILTACYLHRPNRGLLVAGFLAVFQVWVLGYMLA